MKKYRYAKKILVAQGVQSAENLLKRQGLQIGLAEMQTATFESDSVVVLDFGQELCGGLRILAFHAKNTPVRIRFGESLTECCADIGGAKNATNDHSNRDFTVHLQNYSDMTFGQTGFRFVRLDFYGDAVIKSVVAESFEFQKPVKYTYTGEDALIKNIYDTAKRTVDLCASKGYLWDGVKRDRLVWIGDIHPEMLALTTLYGRMSLIEKSIDFVKAQTPLPNWMNGY
ncbi:MAG: family 78 glycoside hydrolase catalytic domain, partial [Clostridia bacterium]|nr:family 78 glycoside hydrolase catalytic domain [Clostridia bacterium]